MSSHSHMSSDGVVRVSNSEIQTFKRCKRKWWLSYYRGLVPRIYKHTGPLALGTRVHYALERYYGYGEDLLKAHAEQVEKDRYSMTVDGLDTTDLDADAELGRIMLEGYKDWVDEEGLDAYLEVIGAEEKLTMPMFGGAMELIGKLDLRVRMKDTGTRWFLDHKTSANFADFTRVAHMDEQQLTYHTLEKAQDDGTRCDGGMFRLLRKVKRTARAVPPFYEQVEVRHNVFTMRSFWTRLHGVMGEIMRVRKELDAGADPSLVAFPTPTRSCNFECNFYAICPMFDDGSAAEAAIDMAFKVDDPYARYEPESDSK